jgi:hypothetical protein
MVAQGQPQIEQVDASAFPMVSVWLQGDLASLPAFALTVSDGGPASLQSWTPGRPDAALQMSLLVDRSAAMKQSTGMADFDGAPISRLAEIQHVARDLLEGLRPQVDSAMLIHFGGGIDNTDLSDNFMVFSLILDGVEAYGERVVYDAMAYGIAALKNNEDDQQALVVLVGGKDQGSQATQPQVLEASRQAGIPILLGFLGQTVPPELAQLAAQSGGGWVAATQGQVLSQRVDSLVNAWGSRHQLIYQAPPEATGEVRLGIIAPSDDTLWLSGSYALPADMMALREQQDLIGSQGTWWTWVSLGALLLIGVSVWGGSTWQRRRRRASIISPTITGLVVDHRKGRLLLAFNLPQGRIPARISLHSYVGRPVLDQVVASHHSRTKVDLNGLDDGVYHCYISHAGQQSDNWEFVWERRE